MKKEEKRGFSSPDFCAGCQNITQYGRSSRQCDKGVEVRVRGGCARNDCTGETLSANRLNGCFQSRLCSLYNLWFWGSIDVLLDATISTIQGIPALATIHGNEYLDASFANLFSCCIVGHSSTVISVLIPRSLLISSAGLFFPARMLQIHCRNHSRHEQKGGVV